MLWSFEKSVPAVLETHGPHTLAHSHALSRLFRSVPECSGVLSTIPERIPSLHLFFNSYNEMVPWPTREGGLAQRARAEDFYKVFILCSSVNW